MVLGARKSFLMKNDRTVSDTTLESKLFFVSSASGSLKLARLYTQTCCFNHVLIWQFF